MTDLDRALETVRAAGYRVSKPRTRKPISLGLNAVGKPYGANFDPNYRMRHRTPPLKRAMGNFPAVSPERWAVMCREAQKAWAARQ